MDTAADVSHMPLSFPERLRLERKRIGLSQEEFGRLGGVSKTAQWLYEAGKNWPTCEYLECLCRTGVDVAFIAMGVRANPNDLDWALLRHAFLLVQTSLAAKPDRAFTPDQLFDAFRTVVEAAMDVSRPEVVPAKGDVRAEGKIPVDE